MSRTSTILSPLLTILLAATAAACLWDSDTLQMERLRFPGVLEIITGKFVRHSTAYYEWRITDRQKKLESKPGDPALIDDLAVAYAKLGGEEEGIPLLVEVLEAHPNRYETLSNLGTLLFFAGRLDESKEHIRRALEVNPDAHFGRERYQLLLTEYLEQSGRRTSGVMCDQERYPIMAPIGFAGFVLEAKFGTVESGDGLSKRPPEQTEELRKATEGVLGMMHFADHRSPILLEALGDLLMTGGLEASGTQLAARAYLSAALSSSDAGAVTKFRQMARQVVAHQIDFDGDSDEQILAKLDAQLSQELVAAESHFAKIGANEELWIASNRDVDAEFARVYYDSLDRTIADAKRRVRGELPHLRLTPVQMGIAIVSAVILGVVLALAVAAITMVRWIRKRRRSAADSVATGKIVRT